MTPPSLRLWIPADSLGRLRLPKRTRYRDGWMAFGWNQTRDAVMATLVDATGMPKRFANRQAVLRAAKWLGVAFCHHLKRENKYQAGESTGNVQQIRVAT